MMLEKSTATAPQKTTSEEPDNMSNLDTWKEQSSRILKWPLSWCWTMVKLDSKPIRELVLEHFVPESALQKKMKELMRKSRSNRDDLELYIRIEWQVIRKNPKREIDV